MPNALRRALVAIEMAPVEGVVERSRWAGAAQGKASPAATIVKESSLFISATSLLVGSTRSVATCR
jgi:hypothetical protein